MVAAAEGGGVRSRRPVPELQVSGVTRPWAAGAAKACRHMRSPEPGPATGGVRGRGDAGAVTRPPWAAVADLFGREKNTPRIVLQSKGMVQWPVRWLVSGLVWAGWCCFVMREKYCWLTGLGWLKPTSEQAADLPELSLWAIIEPDLDGPTCH